MDIQWLGTAGFRLEQDGKGLLVDPYLSRNPGANPAQPLTPETLAPASHILVSHGHFDHLMDVPAIARTTGARVVCSPTAAQTLVRLGMDPARITVPEKDGQGMDAGPFRIRAFPSAHVKFDLRLVGSTLIRMGRSLPRIFPLFRDWPCGQVFSWRMAAEGRSVHFFGSAGSSDRELASLRKLGPPDVLLVPLQGHSEICGIALNVVKQLEPDLVIPHHHDDFFPPLSQTVDIRPFVSGVAEQCPGTRVRVPGLNQIVSV